MWIGFFFTGSIREIPDFIEILIDEGGFILGPFGGRIQQRLLKKEWQGVIHGWKLIWEEWYSVPWISESRKEDFLIHCSLLMSLRML